MTLVLPVDQWPEQGGDALRLHRTLSGGVIPHALLLVGPAAITGPMVQLVAQFALCTATLQRPCGQCAACTMFQSGSHPNWHEVPTDGKSIKTQAIDDLQAFLAKKSHGGGPQVYSLCGVDDATLVAANRLLKVLEEPLAHSIAILTAENLRQVLVTIQSRCHIYRFLEESGHPREASVTPSGEEPQPNQMPAFAAPFEAVVQWTESLLEGTEPPLVLALALHKVEPISEGPDTLDMLLTWLNELLHGAVQDWESSRFPNYRIQITAQSALSSEHTLAALLKIVMNAKVRTSSHVAGLLNLEQMCIRMRRVIDGLHGGGSPL